MFTSSLLGKVIKGLDLDVLDGEFLIFVDLRAAENRRFSSSSPELEGCVHRHNRNRWRLSSMPAPNGSRHRHGYFRPYALLSAPQRHVDNMSPGGLKQRQTPKANMTSGSPSRRACFSLDLIISRGGRRRLFGGQRQARAIGARCPQAQTVLFDEPLSTLMRAQGSIPGLKLRASPQTRATMVYVIMPRLGHDLVTVICGLNGGIIEQVGTRWNLYNDRPTFCCRFYSRLTQRISSTAGIVGLGRCRGRLAFGPEHITIAASGAKLRNHFRMCEHLRSDTNVLCKLRKKARSDFSQGFSVTINTKSTRSQTLHFDRDECSVSTVMLRIR